MYVKFLSCYFLQYWPTTYAIGFNKYAFLIDTIHRCIRIICVLTIITVSEILIYMYAYLCILGVVVVGSTVVVASIVVVASVIVGSAVVCIVVVATSVVVSNVVVVTTTTAISSSNF